MKRIFIVILALLSCCVICSGESVDFLENAGQGQDASSIDGYEFSATLKKYNDGFLWNIPKGPLVKKIMLPVTTVEEFHKYKLNMEFEPAHFMKILFMIRFFNEDGEPGPNIHLMTFENSSAFINMSKEIIAPKGAEELEIDIHVWGTSAKPGAVIGYFKKFNLEDMGKTKKKEELKKYYGKNLLPFSNFKSFSSGKKSVNELKLMPFGQKSYLSEITKDKNLKIKYTPGDYQYITYFTPKLPFYGTTGTMKCRIKGKGKAQFMLWFNRPNIHTIYKHFGFAELPNDFKEYTFEVFCDDPLAEKIGVAIACKDASTEFEISDISFVINQP